MHPSAAATAPYFFLSYAHKSRGDAQDEGDSDFWIDRFFRDLCRSVEQQAGMPRGSRPGFMDRDRRAGDEWPVEVVQALTACNVFVPLYSGRYFTDEYCGKEWNYFASRAPDTAAQEAVIVPVIWEPADPGKLPKAARALGSRYHGSEAYEAYGLYRLMKLSRYRDDYARAVGDLAGRIVTAAASGRVAEGRAVDYGALDSAFGRAANAKDTPWVRWVRITIVASRHGELPQEREDSSRYGPSALDWKPYAPHSVRPVADSAAELARSLGFRADVADHRTHGEDLLLADPRTGPQVLIIDPWALLVRNSQQLLQRLNGRRTPWVQAIVPWNAADDENRRAEGKLRAALEAYFGDKLAEVAPISPMAAHGVPGQDDFDAELPRLIEVAAKKYLRHAAVYPPPGPVVERPRLW